MPSISAHRDSAVFQDLAGTGDPLSQGLVLNAVYSETRDAASDSSTAYTISPGDTFNGNTAGYDTDWIRIDVTAGNSYTIDLTGRGFTPDLDVILQVVDDAGNLLAYSDAIDYFGGNLDARITFVPAVSGSYYLVVDDFSNGSDQYSLKVSAATPVAAPATMHDIADYLQSGFWQDQGVAPISFNASSGDTLTVNISGLAASAQQLAKWALDAWAAVTGLKFSYTLSSAADLIIDDTYSGAFTTHTYSGTTITKAEVNVGYDWIQAFGTTLDSYTYQTLLHEIGHALGLGHAGNYNGDAQYGIDNTFVNDSWQATVMSYFSQVDNSYVNADFAYVLTPMIADVIAIQGIYGPASLRTGNTVYGENSTAGGIYDVISQQIANNTIAEPVALTIVDSAGTDSLNLASDTYDQIIDLTPGSNSSIYGLVGNLSIAYGTVIENVIAGSGNDDVTGNGAANDIHGGLGSDTLRGGAQNDTLRGGNGADALYGDLGNDSMWGDGGWDSLYGGDGDDVAWGGAGNDKLYGRQGADTLYGDANADSLWGDAGNDSLLGGDGYDALWGGEGADTLRGGALNDRLRGGNGADALYGDLGNDTLWGEGGWDSLYGGDGDDVAWGGAGNDRLYGRQGDDRLYGGANADRLWGDTGNDTLNGGTGTDTLRGGAGADTFVFADGFGQDVIGDFDALNGLEKIDLSAVSAITDLGDLMANHIAQVGADVVIDDQAGNTITLTGVNLADLDASDFVF